MGQTRDRSIGTERGVPKTQAGVVSDPETSSTVIAPMHCVTLVRENPRFISSELIDQCLPPNDTVMITVVSQAAEGRSQKSMNGGPWLAEGARNWYCHANLSPIKLAPGMAA
jgi:hypothetical protein